MKFLTIILSFSIGFIVFMPKENLFFTLQKELKKESIYINTQTSSNIISLNLKNSIIFINGIDIAKIKNTTITPLLLLNKIDIKNLHINFNNLNIKNLHIIYSIINPLKITITGISNFAKIDGEVNLKTKELKIYLLNLTNNSLKSFLKKDKKGYFYAQKF